mmetsp:Transcript_585/g.946  ORF Transcript_585/g.946 Transcript_585/m.946 type:complete len:158 (+) Transcript_585:166-639(+)
MLIQGPRMITSQHGRIVSRIKLSRASSICGALPSSCNILYQTHSTCAAATDDDVVEEDVAVHVSHKTSIRRMNAIKQNMPRLQKLRQRLETDPPLPSILQAASSSSSSSSSPTNGKPVIPSLTKPSFTISCTNLNDLLTALLETSAVPATVPVTPGI